MRPPYDPDPTGRSSTASHPVRPDGSADHHAPEVPSADRPGSSLITLHPAKDGSSRVGLADNTDESPTIITRPRPPANHDLADVAGRRLGHFELIEAVGSGGMAAVLKARDLELGRIVALKILPPDMARDPENVTRFKQEGRAAARLDHDNIARAFYCGEDQGLHFIAFEYVEGENLRTRIDRNGTIPPAECVGLMIQVAAGLGHAASRGVVHRDVKPSNLVLTPAGRIKIVDMGLARHTGTNSVNGGVTQSGTTLGTFDYISPEQALDPRRADVRSDIYSLGCAFYHALTGRPPVPEGTAAKKLHAHQHEPVVDPREYNPRVPTGLAVILARMMAKDVTRRYQTPADLIADLSALARMMDLPSEVIPAEAAGATSRSRLQAFGAEPPPLPIGLAVGVAGIAVAIAIAVGTSRPDPEPPAWSQPFRSDRTGRPADPTAGDPTAGDPTTRPAPPGRTLTPTEHLVRQLTASDDSAGEIRLDPGRVYDLSAVPDGVLVRGRSLTVKGHPADPPIVRLAAVPLDPGAPGAARPRTLTVADGPSVRFEGVRFELVDGPAKTGFGATDDAVGLAVTGSGRVAFSGCWFGPAADLEAAAVTGLAVVGSAGVPPTDLGIGNSYFAVRQTTAVRLVGPVRAVVSESAFAPHQAAFVLTTPALEGAEPAGSLTLRHCSFLLDRRGAVVEAEETADWRTAAGYCVFATPPEAESGMAMDRMMSDLGPVRPSVLRVRTTAAEYAEPRFDGLPGEANVYYNVDPLATLRRGYTLAEYRAAGLGDDPAAVAVAASPWAVADPAAALAGSNPWPAFRLKLTSSVRATRDEVVVGVRFRPGLSDDPLDNRDKIYHPWPPPFEAEPPANPRVKVWWPGQPTGEPYPPDGNVFRRLEDAVARLGPDDELLVRGDGPVAMPAVPVVTRLTVKPYPGSRPVLVPAGPDQPSLFRLINGELVLDGLEFRLPAPTGNGPRTTAVVAAVGRKLILRDCVVTLNGRPGDDFSAVLLAPPADDRAAATGVRVDFDQCLIRGGGRAVWATAARRFDLNVTNSIAALTGPLLRIDPGLPGTPTDADSVVRLSRLTAVSAGPLLDLRAGTIPGTASGDWVPLKVDADECIFAPTGTAAGSPLVVVAGVDDPDDPAAYLTWQSMRPNWYPGREAAVFLRLSPADPIAMPKLLASTEWFAFTREDPANSLGAVGFARPPAADHLADTAPADLNVIAVQVPDVEAINAGAETGDVARPSPTP